MSDQIKIRTFANDGTVDTTVYDNQAQFKRAKQRKPFKETKFYQILDVVTNVAIQLIKVKRAVKGN